MSDEIKPNRTQVPDGDRAVVRHLFERVYSKGELGIVDELVSTDFTGYSAESADAYLGADGMKTHVSRLRTAFNGFTVEIDALQVEGDTFEVQWTARGTHERRFLGVQPTCTIGQAGEEPHGNRIAVEGVATGTIENGTIHESTMVWDVETLRHQLGAPVDVAEPAIDSRESSVRHSPPLGERLSSAVQRFPQVKNDP